MLNIRIKTFGSGKYSRVAATKVQLRSSKETREGCRWLEPGEVVAMDEDEAVALIAASGNVLEITTEPANRPLTFSSPSAAADTSTHNVSHPGRADAAREAMKKVTEQMEKEAAEKAVKDAELSSREEAIRQREIELGLRTDDVAPVENITIEGPEPSELEQKLNEDLADYEPENNVVSRESIEEEREKAEEERPVKRQRQRRARGG